MIMDVYYSDFGISPDSFTSAAVSIVTSWDGSPYALCNVRAACGPNKSVYPGDRQSVARVGGIRMDSPANIIGEYHE